jgi:anti-sigma factor RsiW
MNCHDAQTMMHGYLDGELDPSVSLQYEEHASQCSACRKLLAEHQALQGQMKAPSLYFRAPADLRERVLSSLRKQRRPRFPNTLLRWVAAAACILFLLGAGFLLARLAFAPAEPERLTREVASAHIRSLQEEHLVDVRNSDSHKIKPWFAGRLDYSPTTIDLKAQGFPLVGGRLDYLNGRPVAAIVYRRRDHLINLFVWPSSGSESDAIHQDRLQGFQIIHWSKAGMSYWLVSDLNATELNEMAQALRE